MSKATNNTNKVTFGKAIRVETGDLFSDERAVLTNNGLFGGGGYSRRAIKRTYRRVDVFANGEKVGVLLEVLVCKTRVYFGFEDGERGLGLDGFRFESWAGRLSLREGKSVLAAHMAETATEKPAQAETVEAEEAAQVETVEDHVVVTNDEGRAFSVVVVMQGDRYGLNDCLTHGSPDPLVEFYDAKHSGSVHGPLGQFVSRYYLSTLAGEDQWGLEPGQGLNLHGGVREWSVSWQNVCEAVAYARRRQAAA
jgi:hypothetical protein